MRLGSSNVNIVFFSHSFSKKENVLISGLTCDLCVSVRMKNANTCLIYVIVILCINMYVIYQIRVFRGLRCCLCSMGAEIIPVELLLFVSLLLLISLSLP